MGKCNKGNFGKWVAQSVETETVYNLELNYLMKYAQELNCVEEGYLNQQAIEECLSIENVLPLLFS